MSFTHSPTSLTVEHQTEALAAIDEGMEALRRVAWRQSLRCLHTARTELRRANELLDRATPRYGEQ